MDKDTMRAELQKLREFRCLVLRAYARGPVRRLVALPYAVELLIDAQQLGVDKIIAEEPYA